MKCFRQLILLLILLSTTNLVFAKDYFGFNFQQDNFSTSQDKLDRYLITHQDVSPNHILFERSGLLKLLAPFIAKGQLVFVQQHLHSIRIYTETSADLIKRLVDHLNEDYDFDQTGALSVAQFQLGNSWSAVDIRGLRWQFAVNQNEVKVEVTID